MGLDLCFLILCLVVQLEKEQNDIIKTLNFLLCSERTVCYTCTVVLLNLVLLNFLSLEGSNVLAVVYQRHSDCTFPCCPSPSLITGFILGQLNACYYLYYREMALQFPWCPQKDSWATWMIGHILR